MKEYEVTVTEILKRTIKVIADTCKDARKIVEEEYKKENIVLDSSDFSDIEIE